MSIKHVILGFLSWRAFTGYELKQVFAESSTLSWSGNSNQIYTPLVELHKEGLVSLEVQIQENRPARKVYSITEKGLAELRSWILLTPEPPVQRNVFLTRLAWADTLAPAEIDALFESYEEKVQTQLLLFRAREKHKDTPERTPREAYLWRKISENWLSFYQNELLWARTVRKELAEIKTEQEDTQ